MDQDIIQEQEPLITPDTQGNKDFVKKSWDFGWAWEMIKIILVAACIVIPIRYFLFQPFIVKGDSMIPNFQDGNYLIVDEISYRFANPGRGDVIVLKYPLDTTQRFIKRIIGLPGETIEIKNGKIDILKDGKDTVLDERKYLPDIKSTDGDINIALGEDQYFVMGDNRPFSYDSRRWGILPKSDIVGRVLIRVLPLDKISYIPEPTY